MYLFSFYFISYKKAVKLPYNEEIPIDKIRKLIESKS